MADKAFEPKHGRIRDAEGRTNLTTARRILTQAGRAGAGIVRQRGHIAPDARRRGTAPGLFARAGIMAPGSRRVIVRARYSRQRAGDLGAAKAHLRYIQRDGITRDGGPGQLYDATSDQADGNAFLDRSEHDPHQFRFIVSPEDSTRLPDLKPFIRDLMRQMEQDLDTKLDWVAIDHFNTGHPHTHVVIRGRDDQGRDLVIARDYIGHGVRARAQALMTLELGPESELERLQKLASEVEQERFTRLDRALLARAKDGILVAGSAGELAPAHQTMQAGRLKTLERLGLARGAPAGRVGARCRPGDQAAAARRARRHLPDDAARAQAGRHRAGRAAACGLRARPARGAGHRQGDRRGARRRDHRPAVRDRRRCRRARPLRRAWSPPAGRDARPRHDRVARQRPPARASRARRPGSPCSRRSSWSGSPPTTGRPGSTAPSWRRERISAGPIGFGAELEPGARRTPPVAERAASLPSSSRLGSWCQGRK